MFFEQQQPLSSFVALLVVSLVVVFSQHVDDSDELCLDEGNHAADQTSPHIPTIVLKDYIDGSTNTKETIEKMLSNVNQRFLNSSQKGDICLDCMFIKKHYTTNNSFDNAMQKIGFFLLDVNDVFPDSLMQSNFHSTNVTTLINAVYNAASLFFDQPLEYKNQSCFGSYGAPGFQPSGGEYVVCVTLLNIILTRFLHQIHN